jgi:RNA polymerase sigma-70 factor (ECF subfamily)
LSAGHGKYTVVNELADAAGLAALHPMGAGADRERRLAPPQRQVIERAQGGDVAAFSQLVSWYQRRVVSTAWRILGNEADALDAAQEVFLRLHRYLRTFRSDQDFAAWLYRLIVNACHDTRRRRRGQAAHLSLDDEAARGTVEQLQSPHDVEASASVLEDEQLVAEALQSLSHKERAALVLRDLEGLSTQEVADILGSSPTTVRSQISIARSKLRAFRDRVQRGRDGRGGDR